jgi:hypothetical protein
MPTELMHGQEIDAIDVSVLHLGADGQEEHRELFGISFSEGDESLYLRPVAPNGHYWVGATMIPAEEIDFAINFREDGFHAEATPAKLSIHASGQVHVKLDERRSPIVAGPLQMPPLNDMRDHHVATFQMDAFSCLVT